MRTSAITTVPRLSREPKLREERPRLRVAAPPPAIVSGVFGAGWALQALLGLPRFEGVWPLVLAAFFLIDAAILVPWAIWTLRRHETAILPHHETRRLVTSGPYAYTRNPIYLGLIALYVAASLGLRLVGPLLLLPLLVAFLQSGVISREERYLAALFPQEYAEYRNSVGRWI
jgi:protein-S-isoprenylcysteine O-methyltransferase Ste14